MSVMEQEVESGYRVVCCTCLSTDRNLISINGLAPVYQIFRLLMYDFAGDRFDNSLSGMEQIICWECLAMMKKFMKFKRQVHSAQEHIRVLALSGSQETMDHTYMSQSLSSLEVTTKMEYDSIFFDYTTRDEWPQYIAISSAQNVKHEQYDVAQAVRENINLEMDGHMLEVPEIVLENPVTGVMSHIVVGTDDMTRIETYRMKGELEELNIETMPSAPKIEAVIISKPVKAKEEKTAAQKMKYFTEFMSEAEMLASREEAKEKVQYASSVYKCELCIIGFYTQQQVEDHFVSDHRAKPGFSPCKVCYKYVEDSKLQSHVETHYLRHICKLCGHSTRLVAAMQAHQDTHIAKPSAQQVVIGGTEQRKNRKKKEPPSNPPKPGDLRKLLSKTTIEGYQCLECDMFFKNSRARKNHVARFHREGLQCDHCKKRFVNRTTLATHLRLHDGPLPKEECPICHKMVRVIQLKYHIQRHENKSRYECVDCNKIFSHLATYQAHLKYSRAHASDQVFKFPCPMCNKGYPTKEAMQDHFNYQHLGKTAHKCPVCDKPIASRANVEKHMMRVHGEKKEKPRNHVCQICRKAFTDKKALNQHEVIHSGARPLTCDLCQQSFKQKASLYTHRKRVHKVFPAKKQVEFMVKDQ
ncbi:zinc finger protein 888-like [Cydia splendana]|uniref:zinc finger protein 888-like n=1 Tax=Cydia splendana TaxID=1100963 RepID=UPI00300C0603